jgi:uncharacterized protein YaiI (UPF0178 family)
MNQEVIFFVIVETGTVDQYITKQSRPDDWVLTRDLPLAKTLLEEGRGVFNDRGREFTLAEIDQRLKERDLMEALRQSGEAPPMTRSFGRKEVQAFASYFDQLIHRLISKK